MNAPLSSAARSSRILSIDGLRGLVILLMLLDHTREFFYLNHPVGDPMDLSVTPPALFFNRILAHLCAPAFVLLTGLGAWLYADARGGKAAASAFLLKRGLFLVILELTVVTLAWSFGGGLKIIYLQVIWAIGLSMIALAALIHLPRAALLIFALVVMLGHNLLSGISIPAGEPGHVAWAILHDRTMLDLPGGLQARTSYPVLPWIGVIAFGYAIGPWFARTMLAARRQRLLLWTGAGALIAFLILRGLNGYGDPAPWQMGPDALTTVRSFLNVTKYPPSADFLLLTLGISMLLLLVMERWTGRIVGALAVFGSVPLFFYLLHLYLLHGLNRLIGAMTGADGLVSVPNVASIWLLAAVVAVPCWFACRAFGRVKRDSGHWWMRYL